MPGNEDYDGSIYDRYRYYYDYYYGGTTEDYGYDGSQSNSNESSHYSDESRYVDDYGASYEDGYPGHHGHDSHHDGHHHHHHSGEHHHGPHRHRPHSGDTDDDIYDYDYGTENNSDYRGSDRDYGSDHNDRFGGNGDHYPSHGDQGPLKRNEDNSGESHVSALAVYAGVGVALLVAVVVIIIVLLLCCKKRRTTLDPTNPMSIASSGDQKKKIRYTTGPVIEVHPLPLEKAKNTPLPSIPSTSEPPPLNHPSDSQSVAPSAPPTYEEIQSISSAVPVYSAEMPYSVLPTQHHNPLYA